MTADHAIGAVDVNAPRSKGQTLRSIDPRRGPFLRPPMNEALDLLSGSEDPEAPRRSEKTCTEVLDEAVRLLGGVRRLEELCHLAEGGQLRRPLLEVLDHLASLHVLSRDLLLHPLALGDVARNGDETEQLSRRSAVGPLHGEECPGLLSDRCHLLEGARLSRTEDLGVEHHDLLPRAPRQHLTVGLADDFLRRPTQIARSGSVDEYVPPLRILHRDDVGRAFDHGVEERVGMREIVLRADSPSVFAGRGTRRRSRGGRCRRRSRKRVSARWPPRSAASAPRGRPGATAPPPAWRAEAPAPTRFARSEPWKPVVCVAPRAVWASRLVPAGQVDAVVKDAGALRNDGAQVANSSSLVFIACEELLHGVELAHAARESALHLFEVGVVVRKAVGAPHGVGAEEIALRSLDVSEDLVRVAAPIHVATELAHARVGHRRHHRQHGKRQRKTRATERASPRVDRRMLHDGPALTLRRNADRG